MPVASQSLTLTTDPRAGFPDPVEFVIDGEQFEYIAPKDSVMAMRLLTTRSATRGEGLEQTLAQARVVFDTVRIGLDLADRVLRDRRIDADGEPRDRTPPKWDGVAADEGWSDPGPTQWERIVARLDDPEDPLELEDTVALFGRLLAASRAAGDAARRPPTS